ncbi:hypothetical protein PCASD_17228 [Puccinia coronata f. sp. avenae]|uniref:Uncharacterized protein n=1 Tax=Puccinia coronata f. sp. avenae TaxID=200324 RepID=A0A2N5T2Z1_9BASI|nr:hypothetical protein PCASD_17228 [Puccinia coronata f. sp. avenae]
MSVDTEMPAQDELTTISNIFQGQWLLFVNAKEANNYWLMRITLNQVISTQDTLTNLVGTQRMMEVLDGWSARDKLARMEQTLQIPPQPLAEPPAPWTQPQLAVAAQEHPLSAYQARTTHQEPPAPQGPALLPQHQRAPPPPPPPPAIKASRHANMLVAPPLVPGLMTPGTGLQPGIHQLVAQQPYPPPQYHEEEGYHAQGPYYPPQPVKHPAHHPYAPYPQSGS